MIQLAIAYSSTNPQGDLGIDYPTGESQVENESKAVYNNVPAQLVAQGLINSKAHNLFLNELITSSGDNLFGRADTARCYGPLVKLPLQEFGGSVYQYPVTLTGMTFGDVVIAKNLTLAICLDKWSSTQLPPK
jgi:hypothetical protein